MLTLAYYMSERITIVVPDGTKEKLSKIAKEQSRKVGNLGMRYLIEGIAKDVIKKEKT